MKLLWNLNHIPNLSHGSVATIGNFDGVHLGHQSLISHLKKVSLRLELPLILILFEPQPAEFFKGKTAPARLSSLREKLARLANCQIDYVYCLHFNQVLAKMSAREFAESYFFSAFNVKYLLIGEDFRFGYERQGDISLLKKLAEARQVRVEGFPNFSISSQRVSSTKIRELLKAGLLEDAKFLLGSNYSICGRVIKGDEQGRLWGVPTANIAIKRIGPALTGVFCVKVLLSGKIFKGVANLGCRPTLDGLKNLLEVHLFDCHDNLYGELLQVEFLSKVREERKFPTKEALIEQIKADVSFAREQLR